MQSIIDVTLQLTTLKCYFSYKSNTNNITIMHSEYLLSLYYKNKMTVLHKKRMTMTRTGVESLTCVNSLFSIDYLTGFDCPTRPFLILTMDVHILTGLNWLDGES